MDMSWSKLWEMVKDRETWCDAVHGVTKSGTWLSDWTVADLKWFSTITKKTIASGKDVEKLEPSYITGKNVK